MPNKSVKRNNKNKMTKKRSQKGGNIMPGNYPDSAWGWGFSVAGNGWQQFMNSLTVPPSQGNALPGTVAPVQRFRGGKRNKTNKKKNI